ncbi:hemerythrin domain-containing protein [Dactylosporangium sp. NBC_01737]|uniref:hemerythrin domain-containing protein n=1 Tax=Dactylosporangium sp. NBC_01737 TaxID=2975959 RepID=UPI002E120BE8|nr:hemerythrin domain-containing protein [Dactylosporangium sp. NBC_01737]
MTTTVERPWVQEMVVVHRVFRRESRLLPELVRGVRPGDVERARFLAGMFREYDKGLHSHHTSEDALLWPKLLARVDLDADLVLRMEQQHEVVAQGLHVVMERLAAWEADASAAARDALAAAMDRHRQDLLVHLDEEERSVLPLVSEHITVAEWDELGEVARSHTPKDKLLFMLGALLEEATPDETARFLSSLPVPARLLWHTIGRRQYAKQMRKVRGRQLDV